MKNIKNNTKRTIGSIYAILIKNFKTVFRSKTSAFTILLGPLIVMLLLVLAFNNSSLYDIHIGTYSSTYSDLSNDVISKISTKGYVVTKLDNDTECFNGVKNGEFNACLVFSPDMKISNDANNTISFYVDPAKMNIIDNIIATINKEILQTSQNVSIGLTNVLLNQLSNTKDELNKKSDIFNILNTNNNKIKDTSNSLKNSAGSIDVSVSYDTFNVGVLRTKINNISSSYNISTTDSNDLNSKLSDIDSEINSTISKMQFAKTKIDQLVISLTDIPSIVDNNLQQTANFKAAVDGIIGNINGISVTNPEQIVSPIKTNVQTIETQDTHIGRFLPMFLVLIIMFVCILLASSLIISERSSNAYLRNAITSTPKIAFLIGAYLTSLIVITFHLIVLTLILNLVIGFSIFSMLYALLPLLFIVSVFILIGICIGYFANSQETSSVFSFVVIAASIFLSNTILPIETMPTRLKDIIIYNPFVLSESLLRKVIIFDFSLDKVLYPILVLVIYSIVLLVLSYIGLKFSKSEIKR